MRLVLALFAGTAVLAATAVAKLPPAPSEVAIIPTGRAPCGMAARGDRLWVTEYETGRLLTLDAAGRVQRRRRIGRYACQIAVGGRWAWVTRDNADEVVRMDLGSGALRRIRVPLPLDVALAAGSAWVTSFETGMVTRIDARSGRVTRVWSVGGHPTGITFCGGRLWIGHGRDATWLTAIDLRMGRTRRFDVAVSAPRMPQCIDGEVWVTTEDAALRVSSRTGRLLAHFRLGETLAEAGLATSAGGAKSIWVTNKERSLVHRIDPVSGLVIDSFPAGPGALAQARFAGSVWITSFAGSDVRRYDP